MKKELVVPKFNNEDEERDFWAKLDISEYADASDFHSISFPNPKPTTQPITIRLPKYLIARVKEQANQLAMPYQILMKQYIAKGAFPTR